MYKNGLLLRCCHAPVPTPHSLSTSLKTPPLHSRTFLSEPDAAVAPTNRAAYLIKPNKLPYEVKDAPYTPPGVNEVVIKKHAVAINPIDIILPDNANFIYIWLKYPLILGFDVAGEIVEVGKGVGSRFKVGDRVVGMAVGSDKSRKRAAEGRFQEYVVLMADMTSPIPMQMSYGRASVLPLGLSTAACGLFHEDQLALQLPSVDQKKPTGQTILVWGGSTSVGSNAIQLAVAAAYEVVITTSSPRNFEHCKQLGASAVFHYNSKTVVQDIVNAMKGKTSAGAMAIGNGSVEARIQILRRCKHAPGKKPFISMVSFPAPDPAPTSLVLPRTMLHAASFFASRLVKSTLYGIGYKFVMVTSLVENHVGAAVYRDFLPEAPANGSYQAKPDPQVYGKGLENVWPACEFWKKGGTSAKKIVVSLE